jgi:trimethylamine--corrinoid protein Co-methyltransferase
VWILLFSAVQESRHPSRSAIMSEVKPAIKVLTREQIEKIHNYSLEILSTTGIRVDSSRVRKLFARTLGGSDADRVVRIPAELVDRALKTAPSTMDIFDRRGNLRFRLGNPQRAQTRFGIGATNLYYQDPTTDAVTAFSRKHMALATRLGSILSGYDVISTVGTLQDMAPEVADLYGSLEMIANTTKPLVMLISEKQSFDTALDLLEHLHGDLSEKPFIIPYFNPITPLVLNEDTADTIFGTIERGLPFIYSNYGMSGATSPITPAGSLAVLNAELLAGLVFSQLIKEGTPIILGSLPAGFDMRSMGGHYTPQTLMLNVACAEMMAHYELPHSGTSGSGPGWGPDLSAAGTLWMNHLTGCLGKVGLAPFVGGNFDSLVFSPAMVVYSNEVIRQARIFTQGFDIDDDSVALNEIDAIGPGGNFLMADQTVALCREANFSNSIWPHLTLDEWQRKGNPQADKWLRSHTRDLLGDLPIPEDHTDMIERGESFIRKKIP